MFARFRSLVRGIRRGEQLHDDMDAEFRHHMEARAADLVTQGMSPEAAARQARLEFGPAESYKDAGRGARGLRAVDTLWMSTLDFKLGARMLARYPGLSIIGGLAIAFAIAVGASSFELVKQLATPSLPLPGGDRIVALTNVDVSAGRDVGANTRDLFAWRQLASFTEMGTSRSVSRNLTTGRDPGEPIIIAEISASAFRLTRTAPLLGRALVPADEAPGAPPVAVIGHDVWQNRFAGAPSVIGTVADIGGVETTIVGVMPEGYRFPAFHSAWIPLRLTASDAANPQPVGKIFARLAPGRSMDDAQAELSALGSRQNVDEKQDTRRNLRPRVGPFAGDFDLSRVEMAVLWSTNLGVGMLLVLICGNVALLMFARAATRQNEIVVRNALGATRGRIVMQLFAEALVLAAAAAALGLTVAQFVLKEVFHIVQAEMGRLPFWVTIELSPVSYAYAAVLTVLAAVIAGVVPGRKITAGGMDARLRQVTAGGGGIRFGGIWTAVIIAQVAVTMAFPVTMYFIWRDADRIQTLEPGFAAAEFVTARLAMDPAAPTSAGVDTSQAAFIAAYAARFAQLRDGLLADPAVRSVTYASILPLMYHPHRIIQMDEGPLAPVNPNWPEGYRVSSALVDPGFFDALGVPVLAGRNFTAADADSGQRVVIVNESFVKRVMGGNNAVGRRLRFIYYEGETRRADREPGPWHQVIGVAKDVGVRPDAHDPKVARIYHPAKATAAYPVQLAVRVQGDANAFAPTLRTLARDVDPALRLGTPMRLADVTQSEIDFLLMWVRVLLAVSVMALGLSLAGLYSVMSFAVSKRTREIGVRVALGASPRHVFVAVFRQPIIQMCLGIAAGTMLIAGLLGSSELVVTVRGFATLLAYALVMLAVCSLACIVPTRRALKVQPTDALRAEA